MLNSLFDVLDCPRETLVSHDLIKRLETGIFVSLHRVPIVLLTRERFDNTARVLPQIVRVVATFLANQKARANLEQFFCHPEVHHRGNLTPAKHVMHS